MTESFGFRKVNELANGVLMSSVPTENYGKIKAENIREEIQEETVKPEKAAPEDLQ